MARGVNQGVHSKAPVATCMVVGCERRAIYRNAESARSKGTQRGYCSIHRALAVSNWKRTHYNRNYYDDTNRWTIACDTGHLGREY
jgi:hypothetical protein